MEELKSCVFCGKGVDRDFAYCPWCGYEFGPGDDELGRHGEPAPEARVSEREAEVGETPHGARTGASAATEPVPAAPQPSVLLRLVTLEELLEGIEQELDRMLRNASGDP